MTKNFVRFSGFVLVTLFICGCSSKKIEPIAVEPIPIKNPEKDVSLEEFDLIVKNQIKGSPAKAIWLEQFATEEIKLEIEKLQKEKETLIAEVEKEKKSKEIFREGTKNLEEEKKQLSQQVSQLSQEKEQIKKLSDVIPAYQKKISVLEAEVLALKKEQVNIQNKKEETQKPPSVVSSENKNAQAVPVRLENSDGGVAYFKITSKKTGKFFIHEVSSGMMPRGVGMSSASKIINLVPGEYTVQITTPSKGYPRPREGVASQTFIVSEEPIADIGGEKVHAVLKY